MGFYLGSLSLQSSLTGEQITCLDFCSYFCLSDPGYYLAVQIFSLSPSNKGLLLTQTWTKRIHDWYLASHEKCPCCFLGADHFHSCWNKAVLSWLLQALWLLQLFKSHSKGGISTSICLDMDSTVLQIMDILHVRQRGITNNPPQSENLSLIFISAGEYLAFLYRKFDFLSGDLLG